MLTCCRKSRLLISLEQGPSALAKRYGLSGARVDLEWACSSVAGFLDFILLGCYTAFVCRVLLHHTSG